MKEEEKSCLGTFKGMFFNCKECHRKGDSKRPERCFTDCRLIRLAAEPDRAGCTVTRSTTQSGTQSGTQSETLSGILSGTLSVRMSSQPVKNPVSQEPYQEPCKEPIKEPCQERQ